MKIAIAAGLLALSGASMAQIYNNGAPNQLNGYEMTAYLEADDFSLSTAGSVGSVTFWDIEQPGISNDGNVAWSIYSDNSGVPGTVVDSGTSSFTHVSTGVTVLGAYNEYQDGFTLNTPFAASAGTTYWLALHLNPSENYSNRDNIYWETTGANGTNPSQENYQSTNGWSSNAGDELAFELFAPAAPEPASMGLLGFGVVGLILRRRAKK